jgi:flagellar hook-associated protein 2
VGLRVDPVGGGQFKQAVKQIMEAESQPLKALEARKAREEAKLKLFQEFKGKFTGLDKALAEMSDFRKFRELKVDLGDAEKIVNVTVDKDKAEPGSYQLQIDQLAARTSVMSNGFEDPNDTSLGIGYVSMYSANGDSQDIYIDDDHASLNGIASAINGFPDSTVRASVIKDVSNSDSPWKLIIAAKKDGAANQINFPDFYFLDGSKDFYIEGDYEAKNAKILVDNFPIEAESNDIANFLPGVNLKLKQAKPEEPFMLTITEDTQKVAGKVKSLIDQINTVFAFITKQNQIDERSDTRTTFAGDTGLQNIEYRLRNLLHEGFFGGQNADGDPKLVFMNQVGIEFDKTGQLTFKEDKFKKLIETDFASISEAITGEIGFAYQMKSVLEGYTRIGSGLLATREQGLRARITDIDRQIDSKARHLERRQQQLVDKFSKLEATLGNLQRQQQYVSAALPAGGGNNIVSQLLGG